MQVTILSGSVVRVWGVLEQVLKKHEHSLNKADRSMRVIRVDMGAGHLVGVRYKDTLLPEVISRTRGFRLQRFHFSWCTSHQSFPEKYLFSLL